MGSRIYGVHNLWGGGCKGSISTSILKISGLHLGLLAFCFCLWLGISLREALRGWDDTTADLFRGGGRGEESGGGGLGKQEEEEEEEEKQEEEEEDEEALLICRPPSPSPSSSFLWLSSSASSYSGSSSRRRRGRSPGSGGGRRRSSSSSHESSFLQSWPLKLQRFLSFSQTGIDVPRSMS